MSRSLRDGHLKETTVMVAQQASWKIPKWSGSWIDIWPEDIVRHPRLDITPQNTSQDQYLYRNLALKAMPIHICTWLNLVEKLKSVNLFTLKINYFLSQLSFIQKLWSFSITSAFLKKSEYKTDVFWIFNRSSVNKTSHRSSAGDFLMTLARGQVCEDRWIRSGY